MSKWTPGCTFGSLLASGGVLACFSAVVPATPARSLVRIRALLAGIFAGCVVEDAGAAVSDLGGVVPAAIVWFPPDVPVYGDAVESVVASPGPALEPPEGLAEFVAERFYPALSSRLTSRGVSGGMQARLDAYRSERGRLLNALADRLVVLQGADADVRTRALAEYARETEPELVVLERDAEELRCDLISGGWFRLTAAWGRQRQWRVGRGYFPNEYLERDGQFQVVRAAAFYEDGFGAEQRGLLLEVAYELRQRARTLRPVPSPRKPDPAAMFFSPALTRLRLPVKMPPELVERIGRFNRDKTQLKQELYETVVRFDHETAAVRRNTFAALTDRQHPRLRELEELAEEIRHGLAAVPRPVLRAAPHVPPELLQRIGVYRDERARIFSEMYWAMMDAAERVRPERNPRELSPEERQQLMRRLAEERLAARNRAAEEFQFAARERIDALRARYDDVMADLAVVATGQIDAETGKPYTGETLLRSYSLAMERFELHGREEVIYRGYRIAMLEPGLSAEQRRLLLGAALVSMAQPLPAGEPIPEGSLLLPKS